ncbi:MAG: pseudouridine-5'-phosphate glycosidase [Vulcanimicrobiota bacterium]
MTSLPLWVELSEEVADALADGKPVVALESSVWAQGLPRPINYEVALEMGAQVRRGGAVPAVVWLDQGRMRFGFDQTQLQELCGRRDLLKVGVGDLPGVLAKKSSGATTVSATLCAAEHAAIGVMATGGVGGIHLNWNQRPDYSADLGQLARTRCLTVCSGVKSVLDIPATVEMLETLGIPVAMYATDAFPQFYTEGRKIHIGFRVDSPKEAARAQQLSLQALGRGVMVTQPVPHEFAIPIKQVDQWLKEGLARAEAEGQTGKILTPFLLDYLARASGGRTLEANRALLLQNAFLAAQIAVALGDD